MDDISDFLESDFLYKENMFGISEYKESSHTIPPIPGKFPYNKDWSHWGGDSKFMIGDYYYPVFISNIFLSNITYAHSYFESGGNNKIVKIKLKRLSEGSRLVFNWFSNLVDENGQTINYNKKCISGWLRSTIEMLINDDKPINIEKLYDKLVILTTNMEDDVKFYVESLKKYLSAILNDGKIKFLSWKELSRRREKGVVQIYHWFKLYEDNHEDKDTINSHIKKFMETSNQIAAFFVLFTHLVLMLDSILDKISPKGSVINQDSRHDILYNVSNSIVGLFKVNTALYRDLAYLFTRKEIDYVKILDIETTHIDYGDKLAPMVGLIFAIFDGIVRGRDLYHVIEKVSNYN